MLHQNRFFIAVLSVILLTAGCTSRPSSRQTCTSSVNEPVCRYINTLYQRVTENFTGYQNYNGQQCTLFTKRLPNGHYTVEQTQGDEPLCLKAWQTIGTLKALPLPPPGTPQILLFTFKPDDKTAMPPLFISKP